MTDTAPNTGTDASYYTKGSEELATETPLTLKKLAQRRKLTQNSERLVIVLVGLPARGKSFVARKLQSFLIWSGHKCKIFNVGKYRRQAYAQLMMVKEEEEEAAKANSSHERVEIGACDANFFDAHNEQASQLREHVAELAMRDMLRWLDGEGDEDVGLNTSSHSRKMSRDWNTMTLDDVMDSTFDSDRISIFDATNSTRKRRAWILEECTSPIKRAGKPTGVVFVESLCDDEELLRENYRFKILNSPDFQGMSEEEALADLKARVKKYEDQYEEIKNDSISYIKIYNLSTKLLVNHIYGRMAKTIVPALMAWNVGTRPVFLCRPGMTPHGIETDGDDNVAKSDETQWSPQSPGGRSLDTSQHKLRRLKAQNLGPQGQLFRKALEDFAVSEGTQFMRAQRDIAESSESYHPSLHTGTSQTGLSTYEHESCLDGGGTAFPLKIYSSTMPRAAETVLWDQNRFPVVTTPNLNPLDKGDYAGMEIEEISEVDPKFYGKLQRNTYSTRFPGGESYRDLISRLESVIIDVEQQIAPVLIVSHVSVLQALIAYFSQSPVDECMSIEVPMNTVFKFTPSRGGGWMASTKTLLEAPISEEGRGLSAVVSASELSVLTRCSRSEQDVLSSSPIWGDHKVKRSYQQVPIDLNAPNLNLLPPLIPHTSDLLPPLVAHKTASSDVKDSPARA